jgi:hypothetical protein
MFFGMLGMLRKGFGHLPQPRLGYIVDIECSLDDQRSYLGANGFRQRQPMTALSASADPSVAIKTFWYMRCSLGPCLGLRDNK